MIFGRERKYSYSNINHRILIGLIRTVPQSKALVESFPKPCKKVKSDDDGRTYEFFWRAGTKLSGLLYENKYTVIFNLTFEAFFG